MKTNTVSATAQKVIRKGWGFGVGQDFARATKDTPVTLAVDEYAKPGHVIGYIAEDPSSSLGFLKYGSKGLVRVHVVLTALADVGAETSKAEGL